MKLRILQLGSAVALTLMGAGPLAFATNGQKTSQALCDSRGFCSIIRVLKTDAGEERAVVYKFRYRSAKNGAPTVVIIPGGPGQTSVADDNAAGTRGIPDDFGVIQTDPRFVGVNDHPDVGQFRNSLTSEGVADDIGAAIESVGVRNPIVYGVSYGTVVATILSHRLSQDSSTTPRAVVLDGVVAKAIKHSDYVAGLIQEWNLITAGVSPDDLKAFQEITMKLVRDKKVTDDQLGLVITVLLMVRRQEGVNAAKIIIENSVKYPTEVGARLVELGRQFKRTDEKIGETLFRGVINCREVIPDGLVIGSDVTFTFDLRRVANSDCDKYAGPGKLYESKNYPIRGSTIVYLSGAHDPVTPPVYAESHARSQKESKTIHLVVPDAGHAIVGRDFAPCAQNFWRTIAVNPAEAARAGAACTNPLNSGAAASGSASASAPIAK